MFLLASLQAVAFKEMEVTMGLMIESNARFVGREEIAQVPTPIGTISWKPVPHLEVIDAVSDVVNARGWRILDEQYGLARDGQKLFGVMRINRSSSPNGAAASVSATAMTAVCRSV